MSHLCHCICKENFGSQLQSSHSLGSEAWLQHFLPDLVASVTSQPLGILRSKIPVLEMPPQSLSGTVLLEETMSCTVRGPFTEPRHRAGFYISWDGTLAVLNLWPWGFTSDPAQTLASPWALLQSLERACRENTTSKDNWCSGTSVHC